MPHEVQKLELPPPPAGPEPALRWVVEHLGDLASGPARASGRFRGGQAAADAALAAFDARSYARRRNEVWPAARRGASGLSPWIRHGLLPLRRVWRHVAASPPRDRTKFRDELLWQEYARHLYARLGARLARGLRGDPPVLRPPGTDAWPSAMRCIARAREELERDGWLVNQTRMWLASHWAVREGAAWWEGEDVFFRELLDGSRAANRLGWQWTVGAATRRPYGFSRWQVEKRAPGTCGECALREACPIEDWPDTPALEPAPPAPAAARDADPARTAGPGEVERRAEPDAVWLTAESLGDADPALAAHPDLPVVFVFDEPLLGKLSLSHKRLAFLAETLGDLAARRPLRCFRGRPEAVLAGHAPAVTFAPVPGFRRMAPKVRIAALHPWPWLCRPHGRSARSFSAWRKGLELPA